VKSRRQTAYRYIIILTLSLNFPKIQPVKTLNIAVLDNPLSFDTPFPGNRRKYPHKPYILPESRVIGIHFAADIVGLSSLKFSWWAPKDACFMQYSVTFSACVTAVQSHPRSLWFWHCKFFLPHSHLTPSLGMNPFEFLDEPSVAKTRVLRLFVGEDFVILACVSLTQCQRVTDR